MKKKKVLDLALIKIKGDVYGQKVIAFEVSSDGTLCYQVRSFIKDVDGLRERILDEVHESRYAIQLGLLKKYDKLKKVY